MATRMSEIGMSAKRFSEVGMRHSAANIQMMADSVANKAHNIVNVFSRNSSRMRTRQTLKSIPTSKAEDELSPMSQVMELPEPEAEVPKAEKLSDKLTNEKNNEVENDDQKELPPLFPWEFVTEDGKTKESIAVKEKILELAIYRRTFVEPADGDEEYVFDYNTLKVVAKELLLSNPNLREKRETLVEAVPLPVISEETFWRNFFVRCNSIRVAEGLPSYLPEIKSSPISNGPFAMFKRGFFGKKKKTLDFWSVGRITLLENNNTMIVKEENQSDLELDVDGDIEKELVKRRPSRAIEMHLQPMPPFYAVDVNNAATIIADKSGKTLVEKIKSKDPENTPDANSPNKSKEPEEHV
ncbi:BSD [Plasmopara halstedii]|uniref:BSD n=1 Tax=Plasmopara halstedii TaxID=4781 RepID=A0A0P1AXP8_PLAHL|nr:BSD [Plasmopara halstedii]CEG46574.1 BSD [Plasmopara halstedii]|eukprot:XP_024582943.1 BSD [Plasmopara halstedii]